MTNPSNSITYNYKPTGGGSGSRTPGVFVHLEQANLPGTTKRLSEAVLRRLYERALQGMSTASYRPPHCPVVNAGDNFVVWLDFYAYPSSKDLEYTIKSDVGRLSTKVYAHVPKSEQIIFGMTDYYGLDYLPLQVSAARWETPCYTYDSEPTSRPHLEVEGTGISLSEIVFGVAWLSSRAFAHKYRLILTTSVAKGERTINMTPTITVTWYDGGELMTEQLQLEVPDCVKAALERCEDGDGDGDGGEELIVCKKGYPNGKHYTIYYSSCDGSILDEVHNDPETMCADEDWRWGHLLDDS